MLNPDDCICPLDGSWCGGDFDPTEPDCCLVCAELDGEEHCDHCPCKECQ